MNSEPTMLTVLKDQVTLAGLAVDRRILGLIPGQHICLSCGFDSQCGACRRQLANQ